MPVLFEDQQSIRIVVVDSTTCTSIYRPNKAICRNEFLLDHQVNRNSRQLYTTGGIGVSSSECNNLLLFFGFFLHFVLYFDYNMKGYSAAGSFVFFFFCCNSEIEQMVFCT